MKRLPIILLAGCMAVGATAAKKALSHEDFDNWKGVRVHSLSNDGNWAAYSIVPQEGDAQLIVRNTRSGKQVVIERGSNPRFLANSQWLIASIKPFFKDSRQAKIDKKKILTHRRILLQ